MHHQKIDKKCNCNITNHTDVHYTDINLPHKDSPHKTFTFLSFHGNWIWCNLLGLSGVSGVCTEPMFWRPSRSSSSLGSDVSMGSLESRIYILSVGWWAGLVFYLCLSLLGHWCVSRSLKHFSDGAPDVAQVNLVSVKVTEVQPDLDGLLHLVVRISCCHPQFGGAIKVNTVTHFIKCSATADFSSWFRQTCLLCSLSLALMVHPVCPT
jgi:hypothetical protein